MACVRIKETRIRLDGFLKLGRGHSYSIEEFCWLQKPNTKSWTCPAENRLSNFFSGLTSALLRAEFVPLHLYSILHLQNMVETLTNHVLYSAHQHIWLHCYRIWDIIANLQEVHLQWLMVWPSTLNSLEAAKHSFRISKYIWLTYQQGEKCLLK